MMAALRMCRRAPAGEAAAPAEDAAALPQLSPSPSKRSASVLQGRAVRAFVLFEEFIFLDSSNLPPGFKVAGFERLRVFFFEVARFS